MSAQELATSMNVSLADLMCLANSVANSMKADGVEAAHHSVELVEAYVPHAVRKMDQFTSTYMTNPEAREAFIINMYHELKEVAA